MTTTFLLVRHAAHDWLGRGLAGRMPGVALNVEGQWQADALVARLEGVAVDAIVSSPQPRTRQTAAPLSSARGLAVELDAAFDEIDFGDWTGWTFDRLRDSGEAWQQWVHQRSRATAPGGEAFAAVVQRAVAGLERWRQQYPDGSVVVVTHGDVVKGLVADLLGLSLDHLERFEVAPASVSVVVVGDGWRQLRSLNGVGSLA